MHHGNSTDSLPAIAYVDTSALNLKMKIIDLNELGLQVKNVLRNNSGKNAVVFTYIWKRYHKKWNLGYS